MPEEKILHLTLKKKWFDMIASGEKKEEYRTIKKYWAKRLVGSWIYKLSRSIPENAVYIDNCFPDFAIEKFKNFTKVIFTNGYAKNSPKIIIECLGIEIGKAKPEWSDNWQGEVFVIKLGKIISRTN